MKQIQRQLTKSIIPAINPTHDRHDFIPLILRDLVRFENRSHYLAGMAYELCSLLCENHQCFEDRDSLLLLSLEVGFRRLDPEDSWIDDKLTHTEQHRGLVNVVFESGNGEAIADLLYVWTAESLHHDPASTLLDFCTGHLIDLHDRVPFSSRLRLLVIRSVGIIGYKGFEGLGVERFIRLLNHLRITLEDVDFRWKHLLLDTLRTPEGIRHLPYWCWELLVEVAITYFWWPGDCEPVYDPHVVTFLTGAEDWDKLEYWMGVVWILWPPGAGGTTEEELERLTLLLFRQRPGAVQELTRWIGQSSRGSRKVPESFKRICKQAHDAVQKDLPSVTKTLSDPHTSLMSIFCSRSIPLTDGAEESVCSPLSPLPLSGDSSFWASIPYCVL